MTSRRTLLPVAFATVNVTVAVFDELSAATAAHDPVPVAGAQSSVTAGPERRVTVAVPETVPAVAVTLVSTPVLSVVVAIPEESVVATPGFTLP